MMFRRREERTTSVTDADPAGARLVELATVIASHEEFADKNWTGVTLIVTIKRNPEEPDLHKGFGYYYTAEPEWPPDTERWAATLPMPMDSWTPGVSLLANAMAERDETAPWNHVLFQIDRDSGKVTTEFSYDDVCPWSPDLGAHNEWVENLRPPSTGGATASSGI